MNRKKRVALAAVGIVTAALAAFLPGTVLAASYLPSTWQQPMDIGGNPIVRAIVALARFVIPIFGAYVMVIGLIGLIAAIRDAWAGRQVKTGGILQGGGSPVLIKLAEFVAGFLLIAIPLTGMWVPLVDALLDLGQTVINAAAGAIRGAGR